MLAPETQTSTTVALTETEVHTALGSPTVPPARDFDRLQRARDLALGTALFLGALPIIVALWAAVRLTSSGPGFYSQVRVGRNGRHYRIFKLRTMAHNCELKSRRSGACGTTRALRRWGASCGNCTSTNCRNSGTCSAAR